MTTLGPIDRQYLVRSPRPEAASKQTVSRRRAERDRESGRRLDSSRRVGPAPTDPETRWARVADREADIYEYMHDFIIRNHGYLVRVDRDRVILDPATDERLGPVSEPIADVEPLGGMDLDPRARPAHDGQRATEARRAGLLISRGPVRLRAPERPGHAAGANEPIDCGFIRVWEPGPPEGVERLERALYADREIETLPGAVSGVMDHGGRSPIEEFHKGIKTGPKVEELQRETAARLFAAIAAIGVVALRLLDLRELGRAAPDAPAELTGLTPTELEILSLAVDRVLTTVAHAVLALGRPGGHMSRPSDGMPGWITLWRGMEALRRMAKGAELERKRTIKTNVHY